MAYDGAPDIDPANTVISSDDTEPKRAPAEPETKPPGRLRTWWVTLQAMILLWMLSKFGGDEP